MTENNNLQPEVLSEEDYANATLCDLLITNQKTVVEYIDQYFLEHKDSIKENLLEYIRTNFQPDLEWTGGKTLEDYFHNRTCFMADTLMHESFDAYLDSPAYLKAPDLGEPTPPYITDTESVIHDIYNQAAIDVYSYNDLLKFTGIGKMTINEVFNNNNKSIGNKVEYNQPIDSKSLLQGMCDRMKSTVNDLKDMMNSINKITSKGKAMAQKVLHTEKSEMKSR